jgi:hypothetical protein
MKEVEPQNPQTLYQPRSQDVELPNPLLRLHPRNVRSPLELVPISKRIWLLELLRLKLIRNNVIQKVFLRE